MSWWLQLEAKEPCSSVVVERLGGDGQLWSLLEGKGGWEDVGADVGE